MNWAPAGYAIERAAEVIGCLVCSLINRLRAMSGHASTTCPKSKPFGRKVDLQLRAARQCNRSSKQVGRYLEVHQILGKGR